MRIYVDTEFIERGYERIELVSLGAVRDDGAEFYSVLADGWDPAHANDWVKANVLPKLQPGPVLPRSDTARAFRTFCGDAPEFWGYFADYDWVLICQLYGAMMQLPTGWPMFCRDVKQLAEHLRLPLLQSFEGHPHNALDDARHTRKMHEDLIFKMSSPAKRAP